MEISALKLSAWLGYAAKLAPKRQRVLTAADSYCVVVAINAANARQRAKAVALLAPQYAPPKKADYIWWPADRSNQNVVLCFYHQDQPSTGPMLVLPQPLLLLLGVLGQSACENGVILQLPISGQPWLVARRQAQWVSQAATELFPSAEHLKQALGWSRAQCQTLTEQQVASYSSRGKESLSWHQLPGLLKAPKSQAIDQVGVKRTLQATALVMVLYFAATSIWLQQQLVQSARQLDHVKTALATADQALSTIRQSQHALQPQFQIAQQYPPITPILASIASITPQPEIVELTINKQQIRLTGLSNNPAQNLEALIGHPNVGGAQFSLPLKKDIKTGKERFQIQAQWEHSQQKGTQRF